LIIRLSENEKNHFLYHPQLFLGKFIRANG
jgi:hypothetical protein